MSSSVSFQLLQAVCFSPIRVEEQTLTAAEFVTQAIDINEPIGNLKKLLEPRLQCSLDGHEICLQDIQVTGPGVWAAVSHHWI